jgi:hypothetical protein
MPYVVAALIAAGPATVSAIAAWRQSRRTHIEVQTNHGKRAGEYLEMLPDIHKLIVDHILDDTRHLN